MAKNKITLDDLDLKVLNELPLIAEIIGATFNKITRLFTPIYEQIFEVCSKNLPIGWEIDKKVLENVIKSFSSSENSDKIVQLENFFQILNSITLNLKKDKKLINYLEIQFGFYYDEEYEDNNKPYFYFNIYKNSSPRFSGKLFPLSYYEKIKSSYQELDFNIKHPDNGNKFEQMEILIPINSLGNINNVADIFSNQILTKFLSDIKAR